MRPFPPSAARGWTSSSARKPKSAPCRRTRNFFIGEPLSSEAFLDGAIQGIARSPIGVPSSTAIRNGQAPVTTARPSSRIGSRHAPAVHAGIAAGPAVERAVVAEEPHNRRTPCPRGRTRTCPPASSSRRSSAGRTARSTPASRGTWNRDRRGLRPGRRPGIGDRVLRTQPGPYRGGRRPPRRSSRCTSSGCTG